MKLIKTCLKNPIGESCLSYLMNISMETPERLSGNDLENIINIWNRKHRRIVCDM